MVVSCGKKHSISSAFNHRGLYPTVRLCDIIWLVHGCQIFWQGVDKLSLGVVLLVSGCRERMEVIDFTGEIRFRE